MQLPHDKCVFICEIPDRRESAVNKKQWFILMAGVAGILLVMLYPRWVYPPHPLMPQERSIGYGFITQPPKPVDIVKEENGRRIVYTDRVAPRIDGEDLSKRIGQIMAITVCGLLILQRINKIESRKKHWILIILVTVGLVLAAHVHTASNTQ